MEENKPNIVNPNDANTTFSEAQKQDEDNGELHVDDTLDFLDDADGEDIGIPDVPEQIVYMQVRLFHLACKRWHKSVRECARFFEKYDLYQLIYDLWDSFHIQGDYACMMDIENILKRKGIEYETHQ